MKICTKCGIEKDLNEFYGKEARCKECKKEYQNKNKEHRIKYLRQRRIENVESVSINKRKYYEDNYKKLADFRKTDEYKEAHRLRQAKRRALKSTTSDGTITIDSTQKLLDEQGGVCNYCGLDITARESRHLDHIHPLSKGGTHVLSNTQWLCASCNLSKSDKLI